MMTQPRALVLLPCCRSKQTREVEAPHQAPLPGLDPLRANVLDEVRRSPLALDPANRDGLLCMDAPQIAARELYCGNLYQSLGAVWDRADVDILIVSAAYGLARPSEGLRTYELQMSDVLAGGKPLYRYWQQLGLSRILQAFICAQGISHVWSLLSDAMGQVKTPYHRVFKEYWRIARRQGQQCYHVKVQTDTGASAGTGTSVKRGEWLAAVLRDRPRMLTSEATFQHEFQSIPGFHFVYAACGGGQ